MFKIVIAVSIFISSFVLAMPLIASADVADRGTSLPNSSSQYYRTEMFLRTGMTSSAGYFWENGTYSDGLGFGVRFLVTPTDFFTVDFWSSGHVDYKGTDYPLSYGDSAYFASTEIIANRSYYNTADLSLYYGVGLGLFRMNSYSQLYKKSTQMEYGSFTWTTGAAYNYSEKGTLVFSVSYNGIDNHVQEKDRFIQFIRYGLSWSYAFDWLNKKPEVKN